MTIFAKLFDTPSGQLLVTKEFDDDEYKLTLRGEGNSFCDPALSFTYETKEARDEAFESVDQVQAEASAAEMATMVASFFKEG